VDEAGNLVAQQRACFPWPDELYSGTLDDLIAALADCAGHDGTGFT
jgi:hypothetical protein